jgi:hypothetical protein
VTFRLASNLNTNNKRRNPPKIEMQLFTLISGLLLTSVVYGQQLKFRGLSVDTIFIYSSSGYYHFDDKGTTTGRTDIYTIAFDKAVNNYVQADYKTVAMKSTYKPDTSEQTIKHLTKDNDKVISTTVVDGLLTAFSSKYVKPTFENVGLDKQEFVSLTDERHIRKVAKEHKQHWYFKMNYSTKEENNILFNGCQNIDTFNLFVSSKFATTGYIIVTDVWDEMHVYIKTANKEFGFEGKYPNAFKQPWYDHSDTTKPIAGSIVNLNINRFLVAILPEKFYLRNTIELQALVNDYIKWYLQRRDIIFSSD